MDPLFGQSGNWNKIRRFLIDRGILECDEDYTIGVKAKWYRLGPDWRNHGLHRETIRDSRVLARIQRAEGHRCPQLPRREVHDHLERYLRLVRVDEPTARRWICQRERSVRQHLTALRIATIQSGQASVIVDAYGRVHSPLTNLRRKARPALRIYGQELVEVDVSNAQPLLLGFLAAKLVTGDWSLTNVQRLGTAGLLSDEFFGLPMEPWSAAIPDDLRDYLGVCELGSFYQEMAATWGLPCALTIQKNKIKGLVFRFILFGPVCARNRYWRAFQRRWPSLATVIEQFKQHEYKALARACQRV